jgi:ABC-2 type transport system ATP-binding protein
MAAEVMIDVVGVTQHYGVRPVLRDVSLQVMAGELVALMGPNGMGKSTLMGVMAGVLWPVEGHVTIGGQRRRADEATELAIRQRVAYLPAEPWVPPTRTGRQWAIANGRVYGVPDHRLLPHVERLLDVFDLSKQGNVPIAAYSTGQKKKIAVCAALATDTPVLLLDEPFAGGMDPSAMTALTRILQHHRQRRDRTVVMATPVPELVEGLADRIGIIAGGQLTVLATVEAFLAASGGASLAEAYQRQVDPRTLEKIERYLDQEQA